MEYIRPMDIEKRSMEIIEAELPHEIDKGNIDVVKRVIHTTADFDYADNLVFSDNAALTGELALKRGATIVTDTNMAKSGINRTALDRCGCRAVCFMADEDVAEEARKREVTRAVISMERAAKIDGEVIFAIGNAPTALFELKRLIDLKKIRPTLIIAVPVGFVNVVEAKEEIMKCGCPYIVARGRKGGSTVAAAIVNALLYRTTRA